MSIEFNSWLVDKKIKGINVGITLTIQDYWEFANAILEKNDLQRKRVKVSGKTYQLLGRDLIDGCVMPPIILAVSEDAENDAEKYISEATLNGSVDSHNQTKLKTIILSAIENKHLIILDGLQRTFTIQDLINTSDSSTLEKILYSTIRAEIYIGLSRTGILYRMITLNTGQTPMSLRHQIEMLYQDYLDNNTLSEFGINLLKESDEDRIRNLGEYKLADVSDMYYAFSTGTHNSYSKQTISTILKESEFLEGFKPESTEDLSHLVLAYDNVVKEFDLLFPNWNFDQEKIPGKKPLGGAPFARNMVGVVSKVQVMAGFGAAINRLLVKSDQYSNLEEIIQSSQQLRAGESVDNPMEWLILCLDEIRAKSKKVGDSQRAYFNYFFRHLFKKEEDSYLDFSESLVSAKEAYDNVYGS